MAFYKMHVCVCLEFFFHFSHFYSIQCVFFPSQLLLPLLLSFFQPFTFTLYSFSLYIAQEFMPAIHIFIYKYIFEYFQSNTVSCDPIQRHQKCRRIRTETVHINNKRCRRCQATDSECYCANTLPTTRGSQSPAPHVQQFTGIKKSTKTIKRCNVILLVFFVSFLHTRLLVTLICCARLRCTLGVCVCVCFSRGCRRSLCFFLCESKALKQLNKNRNNKHRKHAMDVYLPFHHFARSIEVIKLNDFK